MHSIFNFDRFINYLKRDLTMAKGQYLYLFGILIGAYFLSLVIFLSLNISLVMLVKAILIGSIILGPCVLEKTVTKYNGILEFTFPVSTFERFMVLILKYVVFLPIIGLGSYYLLTLLIGSLQIDQLDRFVREMSIEWVGYKPLHVMLGFQAIFLVGYLSFERHPFLKTILTIVIFSTAFMILSGMFVLPRMFQLVSNPEMGLQGLISNANIEENMPSYLSAIKEITKYFLLFVFPLGLWIVGFFKVREKEI